LTAKLRALVIGAGPMVVQVHLPALRGRVELVAVSDLDPARADAARREFGFREASGDAVAALARDDIDIVYVFGSAQMHFELGMRALANGKHLFVEKPVAPSWSDARAMADAADERGLIAVGGHNRRFLQSFAALREKQGAARWRHAEAIFHKPETGRRPGYGARSWLGANGIHALDALVYMMGGLPAEMTAFAEGEHVFSALMRWEDGAQAAFLSNNAAGERREEYVFHGIGETHRVVETGLAAATFPVEHDAFLASIRNGRPPPHSLHALVPSLYLMELVENGHSGALRLPGETPPAVVRAAREQTVLVLEPAGLLAPLARHMPNARLVSWDDVRAPRGDVTAAILGRGSQPLTNDILVRLPNLAVVGIAGQSLARYAPEALFARNIALVNASAAYAESVAEFALALAILARRRAFVAHEIMREGRWGVRRPPSGLKGVVRGIAGALRPVLKAARLEKPARGAWRKAAPLVAMPPAGDSRDLKGAAVGLIGWGAIARAFARRLLQAGARVSVWSEHAPPDEILATGAAPAALAEVLAADVVSLHRGLTPGTRHFLGHAELAKLRAGSVLINVARGALIEPDALLARLNQGDIFACLDTFENEPPARTDPLRALPNVFLTSHIAGGSPEMHAAAAEEVVVKVAAFLAGDAPETVSAAHAAMT
jgi:phosphoglycerate dehydrogenase-like enzyme/predicted dehydrogenase